MQLSDYKFSTVQVPQIESGNGMSVLSTGEKARGVLCLSAWTGTNTVATAWTFAIIQQSSIDIQAAGTYPMLVVPDAEYFALGQVDNTLNNATQPAALQFGPFATKGAGVGGPAFAIIPPNCMLVGFPTTNLDGTAFMQCISAEID